MPGPSVRLTWGEFKKIIDEHPDVTDGTPMCYIDISQGYGFDLDRDTFPKNVVISLDKHGELCIS